MHAAHCQCWKLATMRMKGGEYLRCSMIIHVGQILSKETRSKDMSGACHHNPVRQYAMWKRCGLPRVRTWHTGDRQWLCPQLLRLLCQRPTNPTNFWKPTLTWVTMNQGLKSGRWSRTRSTYTMGGNVSGRSDNGAPMKSLRHRKCISR